MSTDSSKFLSDIQKVIAVYQGNYQGPIPATSEAFDDFISGGFLNPFQSLPPIDPNDFLAFTFDTSIKTADQFQTAANSISSDPSNVQSVLFGLFGMYKYVMGISNPNPDLTFLNDAALAIHFKALFADFLKNLDPRLMTQNTNPDVVFTGGIEYLIQKDRNVTNFAFAFARYLSVTAVVQNTSPIFGTGPNFGETSTVDNYFNYQNPNFRSYVQSYRDIYEAFNGPITNATQQNIFQARFQAYYNSEVSQDGFFHVSQDLAGWYVYNQNLYYNPTYAPNATVMNPKSTFVLNEILRLLIEMIGTVQNVAAAQANSLKFLASWQASYTEKLNKIHTFTQGDGTVLGTFGSFVAYNNINWDQNAAQQVRVALNNVNQSYITKLQANQQTIADQAKSLQTNVNQSNDAANQQGSVADSVLQELATILSSIFR